MAIGVRYLGEGRCEFSVWAPLARAVTLHLEAPRRRKVSLEKDARGYWKALCEEVAPGTGYRYAVDGGPARPDPASFFQPDGVHGASAVVDHDAFRWHDTAWQGLLLERMVMYELHVGTFSQEGTFAAIEKRLEALKKLGVNAIELMPVAQFPGRRNWGYDGTFPYAPQNSYGGPDGLKRLVDACHRKRMAVILDVVYNHLGPEGNYLRDFGPYFTDRYRTPWGEAVNYDGPYSDGVREYIIGNACHWFREYHIDALRLDAVHGIFDMSATHILAEMAERVSRLSNELGRKCLLIAESDLNDSRLIRRCAAGGYGLDGQWCDDFHHALHTVLTGERRGYYEDFGKVADLATALRQGFVYTGEYSTFRKRRFGNSYKGTDAGQLTVFAQNHDQVGNRMLGERLTSLISFEALKVAAASVILSPYVPLLFMGEEYGEKAPFFYFVSHGDPALVKAVREGRRREFRSFAWQGEAPDPQSQRTFAASRLRWDLRKRPGHRELLAFYTALIRLRAKTPALAALSKKDCAVTSDEQARTVLMVRTAGRERVLVMLNYVTSRKPPALTVPAGSWIKYIDSADRRWKGGGATLPRRLAGGTVTMPPMSVAAYREEETR